MKSIPSILFWISSVWYAAFWIWAIVHATLTPQASRGQKIFWAGAMFVNPSTAIWYWYIWKRWAFWVLFSPIFGFVISLPFVVRSLLSKAAATNLTNTLFALGTSRFVILLAALAIFPLVLRLAALLHLGRNTQLSAMNRNDWVVSLALPIFGFGAGIAYCASYARRWAIASLLWWMLLVIAFRFLLPNLTQALIPAGEERREQLKLQTPDSTSTSLTSPS